MIILRTLLFFSTLSITWLQAPLSQSATYYISPAGSDSNPGTSEKPWLTFAYAIDAARASCGDTLVLKDGTYGDGTRTGKVSIASLACKGGKEFTLAAENQRRAKLSDSGNGYAILIHNSSYIIVDGLYARSTNLVGATKGHPLFISISHHITIRNTVGKNPNKAVNTHVVSVHDSEDILLEANEGYDFHRHCVLAWNSRRVVVRQQYCHPRDGADPNIFPPGPDPIAAGKAGALLSMYPCTDCILENAIADGPMFLIENNATFGVNRLTGSSVLMSGSRTLGSICNQCNQGNGIYLSSRKVADLNHTPQNITIRDVAIVDFKSRGSAIRASDGVNITIEHVTVTGAGGATGITADDGVNGATPTQQSIVIRDTTIQGLTGIGFNKNSDAYQTWSGDNLNSYNNRTNFSPSLPAYWGTTTTTNPELGTCQVWIPSSSPLSGKGTGGSDIGATILYRYINGNLTSTPLWDPRTGEFPHGAADPDGTNRVSGQSLFDIHKRLNVNTRDCPFPKDYGNSDSNKIEPTSPVGLKVS